MHQPWIETAKDHAWEHLLKTSVNEAKRYPLGKRKGKEDIVAAFHSDKMKKVIEEAKQIYGEDTHPDFHMIMIKDGCFFLQLMLLILGYSDHIGYLKTDRFFGSKIIDKDVKQWIVSMFYVGNQIPLVVLNELMKEGFFQNIINKAKENLVNTRLSLFKKVLYEALVLPALRRDRGISRKERKSGYHEPFDLMHALYNIVIHGHVKPPLDRLSIDYNEETDLESSEEEIANEDMKYDEEDDSSTEGLIRLMASAIIGFSKSNVSRKRRFLCATELKEAGIRIKKLKNGGVRSINFTNYYWWPWAYLYLPVFVVEDNTEKVLLCLKTYELLQQQQVGKKRREFGSYLCLMSDIVQSSRDARMLEHEGVLVANSDGIGKVSGILRRLSSEDVALTPDLILLRSKLRDYTRPWARYKNVLNLVVFLTLLQTLFAILAYFKPPKA